MFGSLKRLLGLEDDKPAMQAPRPNQQNALQQPLPLKPVAPMPRPDERGASLISQAGNAFGFTPSFNKLLGSKYASVGDGNWQNNEALRGVKAAGQWSPQSQEIKIQENNKIGTLLHEGLHAAYDNPANRRDFSRAFSQVSDPGLQDYLNSNLSNYKNYRGGANDIRSLSPDIQNEVHSHTAEYYNSPLAYENSNRIPRQLGQYYSRFYNPEYGYRRRQAYDARAKLSGILGNWGYQ